MKWRRAFAESSHRISGCTFSRSREDKIERNEVLAIGRTIGCNCKYMLRLNGANSGKYRGVVFIYRGIGPNYNFVVSSAKSIKNK